MSEVSPNGEVMGKLNFTASVSYATSLCIAQLHFCVSKNFTKQKKERIFRKNRFVLSFCLYKGLGLAHAAFVLTNAMLAFSGVFEFSAKNITDYSTSLFPALEDIAPLSGGRTLAAIFSSCFFDNTPKKNVVFDQLTPEFDNFSFRYPLF